MGSSHSAIVVGGGLVGCCSAYYLAQSGWAVTLLERDRLGSGASSGNCGFVCPSHVLPLAGPGVVRQVLGQSLRADAALAFRWRALPGMTRWLIDFAGRCTPSAMLQAGRGRHALLTSSSELYRTLLQDEGIDCEWRDRGLLIVFRSARGFDRFRRTAEVLRREFGLSLTAYAGERLPELEPALKSGLAGGWFFPDDAHLRPEKLLGGLRDALLKRGVSIQEGVTVNSLTIRGGQLESLQTSAGSLNATATIIATGAEAPAFAKSLGCRIPIRPGKGYSVTMAAGPRSPKLPLIFDEHHVAVTPLDSALRIGSTMEFAGYDRSVNPRRAALLMKSARAHLVEVPSDDEIPVWAGWRPMTFDGLPCIDRAPAAANVIVAAGGGMIGLATAPASGKLAAALAMGIEPPIDPAPYAFDRFD